VIEGEPGLNLPLQKTVDEAVVEGKSLMVDTTIAAGHDPRPGNREAICPHAQVGDQIEVLVQTVVMVARHIATHLHVTFVGESIPDRFALAAFEPGPLDLIRGRGNPPRERPAHPAALEDRCQGSRGSPGALMSGAGGSRLFGANPVAR